MKKTEGDYLCKWEITAIASYEEVRYVHIALPSFFWRILEDTDTDDDEEEEAEEEEIEKDADDDDDDDDDDVDAMETTSSLSVRWSMNVVSLVYACTIYREAGALERASRHECLLRCMVATWKSVAGLWIEN